MNLHSVSIKRLRSIETCDLGNCGSFNVLVGKNNSGKSNILSAIDAFFTTIRGHNLVNLEPPLGKEIDFFEKQTGSPIEISPIFSLSLAERDALIQDIIAAAPQLKTAVEGIDPGLRLTVTVMFTPPPRSIGCVSNISLLEAQKPGSTAPRTERIILKVDDQAAEALHRQQSAYTSKRQDAQAVREMLDSTSMIDSDDWPRMREILKGQSLERATSRFRFLSMVRRMGPEVHAMVERTLTESSSYKDFSDALLALAARIDEDAVAIQQSELKAKITTFAGQESTIPTYAENLLARVARMKVLHLTERRKPIGREEAERLLSLKITRGGDEVLRSVQETVLALLGVKIDAFRSAGSPRPGET